MAMCIKNNVIKIELKEHQSFCLLPKEHKLEGVDNKFSGDNFCGLYYDWVGGEIALKTSYFIGACWLDEGNLALQVSPKIKNIDYLSMFMTCFKRPKISKKLSEIYQIDFNQPKIALDSNDFEITPLLIVHFLQLVKSIVKKGLKKGYYPVRENLNAKIKGKINIANTLKHNIFRGQNHKTVCDYQAFGIDCLENRLLKKALKFVHSYLAKSNIKTDENLNENLKQTLAYCLAPFALVGDERDVRTLKQFKNNAFFKEYAEGLNLAKMILKRFAYNFKNTTMQKQTPPFWIDMSLLFELYVYALLPENNDVKYQVNGSLKTQVDFLIGAMIIDTKYKTQYKNKCEIQDIRQLSGYGRDEKIREKLGFENNEMAECLIIYPQKDAEKKLSQDLWGSADKIKNFKNFKKIGVELPQHKHGA